MPDTGNQANYLVLMKPCLLEDNLGYLMIQSSCAQYNGSMYNTILHLCLREHHRRGSIKTARAKESESLL